MPTLALLQPDSRERARISAALGDGFDLIPCGAWKRLQRVLRERKLDGAIIDPYGGPEGVSIASLQRLRRKHPHLAIIIYSEFTAREMDLYALGHINVDGVIRAEEIKSGREIQERVGRAMASALATSVEDTLRYRVPPLVMDSLKWSVENAHRGPHVNDLARALDFTPRSLSRDLVGSGGPPPGQILLWGRLIRAAKLLEDPERTVESTAHLLGYSTGAALGKALRQSTKVAPTRIAEEGGVEVVVDAFIDAFSPAGPTWDPDQGDRRRHEERRRAERRQKE